MAEDNQDPLDGSWDPNKALTNLTMEKALGANETPQVLAKRLFEENLPVSVMAICHLATYSESEAIRYPSGENTTPTACAVLELPLSMVS